MRSSMGKRPTENWDEQDAFTPWRRWYHWRPGDIKKIKQAANRRDRRRKKKELKNYDDS